MRQTKKTVGNSKLLSVVLALLVILFVLLTFMTVKIMREAAYGYRYRRDVSDLEYMIAMEDYEGLEESLRYALGDPDDLSAKEKSIHAVALYHNAAKLYKALSYVGNTELADKQKARMDAALAEMGEFSGEAEKIDALYGSIA